jgi:hypothetical protein
MEKTNNELIDGCFSVTQQRWGTWVSQTEDGQGVITALTEEGCVKATRWYLKARQDGFTDCGPTYNGVVDGKL